MNGSGIIRSILSFKGTQFAAVIILIYIATKSLGSRGLSGMVVNQALSTCHKAISILLAATLTLGHPSSFLGSWLLTCIFGIGKTDGDEFTPNIYVAFLLAWIIGFLRWMIFLKFSPKNMNIWKILDAFVVSNSPAIIGLFSFYIALAGFLDLLTLFVQFPIFFVTSIIIVPSVWIVTLWQLKKLKTAR